MRVVVLASEGQGSEATARMARIRILRTASELALAIPPCRVVLVPCILVPCKMKWPRRIEELMLCKHPELQCPEPCPPKAGLCLSRQMTLGILQRQPCFVQLGNV